MASESSRLLRDGAYAPLMGMQPSPMAPTDSDPDPIDLRSTPASPLVLAVRQSN
ncbi:hypothetical protein [Streptomyces sp. ISL-66]|uniref:hypothetical protein n=1 Tax=Streptomyces sp. ISL-66 TaxID=2819186 RepID=UPI0020356769|nr:hypothetical protein [Streptomyces sp. ISL-66]